MGSVVMVGVDIGQRVDPTAVVVTQSKSRRRPDGHTEMVHTARDLGRLPLGTSYPDVASKLVDIVSKLEAKRPTPEDVAWQKLKGTYEGGWMPPILAVDATGVGRPVIDLLTAALRGHSYTLYPVTFTHGDKFAHEGGEWRLGKAFLVSQLQAVLQTERLDLPRGNRDVETMVRELQDYEIKVDVDANDKYGAFRVGSHDDLVTALGLAICFAEKIGNQGPRSQVIPRAQYPNRRFSS